MSTFVYSFKTALEEIETQTEQTFVKREFMLRGHCRRSTKVGGISLHAFPRYFFAPLSYFVSPSILSERLVQSTGFLRVNLQTQKETKRNVVNNTKSDANECGRKRASKSYFIRSKIHLVLEQVTMLYTQGAHVTKVLSVRAQSQSPGRE